MAERIEDAKEVIKHITKLGFEHVSNLDTFRYFQKDKKQIRVDVSNDQIAFIDKHGNLLYSDFGIEVERLNNY